MGMPIWIVVMTVWTALSKSSKAQTAAEIASGWPWSFSVSSVMMPSVPSEPTKSPVRSYPAELLRAPDPVRITRPSASTTSSPP